MTQIREGFWSNKHVPQPGDLQWDGQAEFLRKLSAVEDVATVLHYRGWSNCRVCSRANGSREFSTNGAVWPEGLRHYIEAHNVRPSQDFIAYINRVTENVTL